MKILISAIACAPHQGSESEVGWKAVCAIARDHQEVVVVTHTRSRQAIQNAQAAGEAPANARFTFHGAARPWHPNRMIARLQSWIEYLHWNKGLLAVTDDLCRSGKIDLAHHVTFATWRVGSPLWQLPVPFVWGPVGGVATMPRSMYSILSWQARWFERLRDLSAALAVRSKRLRDCVRGSAVVVASNRETQNFLACLKGTANGIALLSANFFTDAQMQRLCSAPNGKNLDGPLKLFAGGNLIGTKGIALALHGLALARNRGVKFIYTVASGGPEVPHLRRLASELGLNDAVAFHDPLRGEDYARELGATHIFLMPSFRENAPVTIMEAMLCGCVPVVADASAQGEIVSDNVGFKVPVTSLEEMARKIADIVIELDRHREVVGKKGLDAANLISRDYSEDCYRERVGEFYQLARSRARTVGTAGETTRQRI